MNTQEGGGECTRAEKPKKLLMKDGTDVTYVTGLTYKKNSMRSYPPKNFNPNYCQANNRSEKLQTNLVMG